MQVDTAVARVVSAVVSDGFRRATVYLSPKQIVRCTAARRTRRNERIKTVVLSVGEPNHAERKFIKVAKKVGEPFPIKKVQLKDWPKKVA